MIFHRQLAVGFFNFIIAGAAGHAQRFVKVFVAHKEFACVEFIEIAAKNMGVHAKLKGAGGIFFVGSHSCHIEMSGE